MHWTLQDFFTALERADTVDDAWAVARDFLQQRGAQTVHSWFGTDPAAVRFLTTCPEWWPEQYLAEAYWRVDHVAHHCVTRPIPLVWGLDIDADNPAVAEGSRRLMEDGYSAYGLRNGLSVPVGHCDAPLGGTVTLGFPEDGDGLVRLLAHTGGVMRLAAAAGHYRLQALMREETLDAVRLTAREREVLLWLAKGMRVAEIADRLKLAEVTVNLHVANAKKKLGAATREQAVAKAVLLGAVQP